MQKKHLRQSSGWRLYSVERLASSYNIFLLITALSFNQSRSKLAVPRHNFGLCPPSVAPSHDHES